MKVPGGTCRNIEDAIEQMVLGLYSTSGDLLYCFDLMQRESWIMAPQGRPYIPEKT